MTRRPLVRQRADLSAQAARLESDIAAIVAASEGANADDEHDPEGATIAFERAQLLAVLSSTRRRIAEVDEALVRVGSDDYGVCVGCGRQIGAERIEARPASTRCVICA